MSFLNSYDKNTTQLLIIVLMSLLIHITYSWQSINTTYSRLSPLQHSNNGVSVLFNPNEVDIHGLHWDVTMRREYGWDFIIQTDNTLGIDTTYDSILEITTNIYGIPQITELLFAFTSDNQKYIAMLIPMDYTFYNGSIGHLNQIYPNCALTYASPVFGIGNIASIPQNDRSCDIAGGDCKNWENMQPLNFGHNRGNNAEIPNRLTFRFEYTVENHEILFVYQSSTFNAEFVQKCRLQHQFVSSNYMKMYVSGHSHDQLRTSFSVSSFEITSTVFKPTVPPSYNPTSFPTHHPPTLPTYNPTLRPTYNPSTKPTQRPTYNPTPKPTPTPTYNPTPKPTPKPTPTPTLVTYNPTPRPTYNPTQRPTHNPTPRPTYNPTPRPTYNPTPRPTYNPTLRPTYNPTQRPIYNTRSPTVKPTLRPSTSPTLRPSIHPTYAIIPNTLPTRKPTSHIYVPQIGAYNQFCGIPFKNIAYKCEYSTDILIDTMGKINCMSSYDCCMCESVLCGLNEQPCNELSISGEYGLYGVKEIFLIGSDNKMIKPLSIGCYGIHSCENTVISAVNVDIVKCGQRSCQNAEMTITHPRNNFVLDCAGVSSCEGLHIHIIIPEIKTNLCDHNDINMVKDIFNIAQISCNNDRACESLTITIENQGCSKVIIKELECMKPNSCNNAKFNLVGDIAIENCHCGKSCDTTFGLDECFIIENINLYNYVCNDLYSCYKQTKIIENPMNGFKFSCESRNACFSGEFTIELNNNPSKLETVIYLSGFNLSGDYSAQNATFIIKNTFGKEININKIECNGYKSCEYTTFITGINVNINEFICKPNACFGCYIKETMNSIGLPCDSNQTQSYNDNDQVMAVRNDTSNSSDKTLLTSTIWWLLFLFFLLSGLGFYFCYKKNKNKFEQHNEGVVIISKHDDDDEYDDSNTSTDSDNINYVVRIASIIQAYSVQNDIPAEPPQ